MQRMHFPCRERNSLDKNTRFLSVDKTMQALHLSFISLMSNAASLFCSLGTLPCGLLGSIDTINNKISKVPQNFLFYQVKKKLPRVRAGMSSLPHFSCCNDYGRGGQATGLAKLVLATSEKFLCSSFFLLWVCISHILLVKGMDDVVPELLLLWLQPWAAVCKHGETCRASLESVGLGQVWKIGMSKQICCAGGQCVHTVLCQQDSSISGASHVAGELLC